MKFLQKYLLTISTLSLLSLSSIWAACFQSLDIGNQDLNNTNNLEVDYIFSNANGNITIKNTLVMDTNITFINGNKTITGLKIVKPSDDNSSAMSLASIRGYIYNSPSTATYQSAVTACQNRTTINSHWILASTRDLILHSDFGLTNANYWTRDSLHTYNDNSNHDYITTYNPITGGDSYGSYTTSSSLNYACINYKIN